MSLVLLAADRVEPLVLRLHWYARAVLRELPYGLEYVFHTRTMPGMPSPVAMDDVSAVRTAVVACRLV
jgi:hypothetical protein